MSELPGGAKDALRLFSRITVGAADRPPANKGNAAPTLKEFPNGDLVGLRLVSSDGGPAIEINRTRRKDGTAARHIEKIHFHGRR